MINDCIKNNHSFNKTPLIIHVLSTVASLRNMKMHQTGHVSEIVIVGHLEGTEVYVQYEKIEGTEQHFGSKKR